MYHTLKIDSDDFIISSESIRARVFHMHFYSWTFLILKYSEEDLDNYAVIVRETNAH